MTDAAWLATPSVRVNPSSQRASNGIDLSGFSWGFPTLEWPPLEQAIPIFYGCVLCSATDYGTFVKSTKEAIPCHKNQRNPHIPVASSGNM